jgi:tol-pal system protein YbgF
MRTRTQRVFLAASLLAPWSACAGSPTPKPAHGLDAAQRALDARQTDQARRIAELEARIALLEADARQTRDSTPLRSGETIRIGATRSAPAEAPAAVSLVEEAAPPTRTPTGKPTSLRLYGRAPSAAISNREPLPEVPVVNETLSVVPLPEQRAKAEAASPDRATSDYRSALHLLQERRFDQALAAFSAFISANPTHALLHKAFYWRGEARYAQRQYTEALSEFDTLLTRFPQSDKAPDALLKMALCFRHLGAEDRAQASFRRLRATYPNSQAASIASREGST